MNLERLHWTKSVTPTDGYAYCEFEVSKLFKLAWKDDEDNANRPERNDLTWVCYLSSQGSKSSC